MGPLAAAESALAAALGGDDAMAVSTLACARADGRAVKSSTASTTAGAGAAEPRAGPRAARAAAFAAARRRRVMKPRTMGCVFRATFTLRIPARAPANARLNLLRIVEPRLNSERAPRAALMPLRVRLLALLKTLPRNFRRPEPSFSFLVPKRRLCKNLPAFPNLDLSPANAFPNLLYSVRLRAGGATATASPNDP
jgi:hypothetical protein